MNVALFPIYEKHSKYNKLNVLYANSLCCSDSNRLLRLRYVIKTNQSDPARTLHALPVHLHNHPKRLLLTCNFCRRFLRYNYRLKPPQHYCAISSSFIFNILKVSELPVFYVEISLITAIKTTNFGLCFEEI